MPHPVECCALSLTFFYNLCPIDTVSVLRQLEYTVWGEYTARIVHMYISRSALEGRCCNVRQRSVNRLE